MRIKSIRFENNDVLNDLEVDFCDNNGDPLDTAVIIGENGTGKTTLLKSIFDSFDIDYRGYKEKDLLNIELHADDFYTYVKLGKGEERILNPTYSEYGTNKYDSKVFYMPGEVNLYEFEVPNNDLKFHADSINVIDRNITQNIPSIIKAEINNEVLKNIDKPTEEVVNKVCNEINNIFINMNLDVKLVGLSQDELEIPIFKNRFGKKFDIEYLSSGEKQVFLRALSLKFLGANNSIILIDEPEISLHPQWQQKIVKFYENIGENNQVIICGSSKGNLYSDDFINPVIEDPKKYFTYNLASGEIIPLYKMAQFTFL